MNFVGLILVTVSGIIGIIALTVFIIKRTQAFVVMPRAVPIELLLRYAVGFQDLSMYSFKKKEIDDYQNSLRNQKLTNFAHLN